MFFHVSKNNFFSWLKVILHAFFINKKYCAFSNTLADIETFITLRKTWNTGGFLKKLELTFKKLPYNSVKIFICDAERARDPKLLPTVVLDSKRHCMIATIYFWGMWYRTGILILHQTSYIPGEPSRSLCSEFG